MLINLKGKSLADISAMIVELQAAETAAKEQETARTEALAKYENEKFQWAQACVKALKGITPETFEAVFTELPAKPVKPAILNTTTKVTRTRTTTKGEKLLSKAEIIKATAPAKYETLVDAIKEIYPEVSDSALKQNITWYCKKDESGIYFLK